MKTYNKYILIRLISFDQLFLTNFELQYNYLVLSELLDANNHQLYQTNFLQLLNFQLLKLLHPDNVK